MYSCTEGIKIDARKDKKYDRWLDNSAYLRILSTGIRAWTSTNIHLELT